MRSIITSGKSISKIFLLLSKITLTAALLARGSLVAPFQIKSSPRLPRILLIDCSPKTKRKASATLDFPEPLGPTMADTGASNSKRLFLAKDLNPDNSIDFRYIFLLPALRLKRGAGGGLLGILLTLTLALAINLLTYRDSHDEMFVVVRTRLAYSFVTWSEPEMLLGLLLE